MRARLIQLLAAIAVIILAANVAAFQNEPEGFRDLKWGQSIEQISFKLNYLQSFTEKYYSRTNIKVYSRILMEDNYFIGDCQTWAINYLFWRDKFYQVVAWTSGARNFDALCRSARAIFGAPTWTGATKYLTQLKWTGNVSEISISRYENDNALGDDKTAADITITSMQIQKEIAAENGQPANTSGW